MYLIGNKVDLVNNGESERKVSVDEAKFFANENRLKYMETSAYADIQVNESFFNLLEEVHFQKQKTLIKSSDSINNPIVIPRKYDKKQNKSDESCC